MTSSVQHEHRGVAPDDPRNANAIAFFKPKKMTRELLMEMLLNARGGRPSPDLEARVEKAMAAMAHEPKRPEAPLSQSLEQVADPWYGLGTHPDIIEIMWKLDDKLPQRCRWVFWGKPALVHPQTGIVFAVGYGSVGYVMRLPEDILKIADPAAAKIVATGNPGQKFDISGAGPEWRFVNPRAPEAEWCRAAFDYAGKTT